MALKFDESRAVRKSMSWLHTWSGLLCGWLLFAVFVTGTLAYFRTEITVWMQPEAQVARADEQALGVALARLQQVGAGARNWGIELPQPRSPLLQISWSDSDRRGDGKREVLDAASGQPLAVRETAGGRFLYDFHYQLHGLDRGTGRLITGICAFVMLLAVLTGIVVHKNIFKDFFTFRPGKGQRSWLDAHNVCSVMALPFFLMISASGVMLVANNVLPVVTGAAYGGDPQGMMADMRGRRPGMAPGQGGQGMAPGRGGAAMAPGQSVPGGGRPEASTRGGFGERGGTGRGERGERGGDAGRAAAPPAEASPLVDIAALREDAARRWAGRGVASIAIRQPGTAQAVVEFRSVGGELLSNRGMPQTLRYSGVTGVPLEQTPAPQSGPRKAFAVLEAMHLGVFGLPFERWLLFVSGVLGSLMIATGLSMWLVARQRDRLAVERRHAGHRIVETLNVAAMGGVLLAVCAYFWANRLVPAGLEDRQLWEIRAFFGVWLLALLHAALRPHKAAWVEQLAAAGVLAALLPVLNALTGGAHLLVAWTRGLAGVAAFDLMALVLGLSLLWAARVVRRHAPRPRSSVAASSLATPQLQELQGVTP